MNIHCEQVTEKDWSSLHVSWMGVCVLVFAVFKSEDTCVFCTSAQQDFTLAGLFHFVAGPGRVLSFNLGLCPGSFFSVIYGLCMCVFLCSGE